MARIQEQPLCDDDRCRKVAVCHVFDDIQQIKARYCLGHGTAWQSANKRSDWHMEVTEDGKESTAPVLQREMWSGGALSHHDDTRTDPPETRDLSRDIITSRRSEREDADRAVPARLEPTSSTSLAARHDTGNASLPARTDEGIGYYGAGQLELTDEQCDLLQHSLDPGLVDIRPDGLLYLPQIHYRRLFNAVFRPGRWAMVPQNKPMVQDSRVILHYHLYINGCFVAEAVGSMEYFANSASSKWDDCVEGAKSDALTRCAKDLGVAAELWDWRYCEAWKKEFAVCVNVATQRGDKWQWRRKDKPPFRGERKPGRGSTDEYTKPKSMKEEADEHFNNIS